LSGEKQCSFLKDGSKKEYDGYGPGTYTVYARNKNRFPTVDADPTILVSPDDSPCKIYAGCYVNVKIGLYVWDNKFGKGVAASLNGVQFAGNGEPFAKKADDDEEFETLDIAEEMTDSDFGF